MTTGAGRLLNAATWTPDNSTIAGAEMSPTQIVVKATLESLQDELVANEMRVSVEFFRMSYVISNSLPVVGEGVNANPWESSVRSASPRLKLAHEESFMHPQ